MSAIMPPDTSETEKIIGGKLTIYQLGWLCLGAGIYAVSCILTCRFFGFIVFLLFLPLNLIGCPFAFKKYGDLSFYKYHKLKYLYKKDIKAYDNTGNMSLSVKNMEIGAKGGSYYD